MDAEIRTLAARLAAAQVLRRDDPMVRRVLTDELFYQQLSERLAAVGLEFVDHPYAEHVSVRLAREQEQAVFGGEETWLSNNLGLARDQIALLVVLWALLILPKRQRQIERKSSRDSISHSTTSAWPTACSTARSPICSARSWPMSCPPPTPDALRLTPYASRTKCSASTI